MPSVTVLKTRYWELQDKLLNMSIAVRFWSLSLNHHPTSRLSDFKQNLYYIYYESLEVLEKNIAIKTIQTVSSEHLLTNPVVLSQQLF